MNNCIIKSISKVYLILLIPLVSLFVISNILVFAEDKQQLEQQQQQNANIASDNDDPSFFLFFEKINSVTESPIVMSPIVTSSIVSENVKESPVVNTSNRTLSQDIQVLMNLDIPELKENLMDAKESLADGDIEEVLTDVTDLENQFLLSQNKTKLTGDFQKIKESIAQRDLSKALDDITIVQTELLKAETEVFKAQLSTPEFMAEQDEEDNLDIPELKENLMDAKESLADGDIEEVLTDVTDLENQFLLSQNKTKLTGDFQKIKESIAQRDLSKALDDITIVQTELLKAETEVFKAQLSTPEFMAEQDEEDNGDAN